MNIKIIVFLNLLIAPLMIKPMENYMEHIIDLDEWMIKEFNNTEDSQDPVVQENNIQEASHLSTETNSGPYGFDEMLSGTMVNRNNIETQESIAEEINTKKRNLDESEIEQNSVNKRIKCLVIGCNKSYSSQKSLSQHVGKEHLEKKYSCLRCGKKYASPLGFKKHKHKCDTLNGSDNSQKPENHVSEEHSEKKFNCEYCQNGYTSSWRLKKHINDTHLRQVKKFVCDYCKDEYKDKRDMIGHINTKHLNIRYKCNLCNQQYATERRLVEHAIKIHTNDNNCNTCTVSCKSQQDLKAHIKEKHVEVVKNNN